MSTGILTSAVSPSVMYLKTAASKSPLLICEPVNHAEPRASTMSWRARTWINRLASSRDKPVTSTTMLTSCSDTTMIASDHCDLVAPKGLCTLERPPWRNRRNPRRNRNRKRSETKLNKKHFQGREIPSHIHDRPATRVLERDVCRRLQEGLLTMSEPPTPRAALGSEQVWWCRGHQHLA